MEEEDPGSQGIVTDLLVKMTRPRWLIMIMITMIVANLVEVKSQFVFTILFSNSRSRTLTTKLTKFIAATGPVARLQLHSDSCRVAVLLPQTTSLEVDNNNNNNNRTQYTFLF